MGGSSKVRGHHNERLRASLLQGTNMLPQVRFRFPAIDPVLSSSPECVGREGLGITFGLARMI